MLPLNPDGLNLVDGRGANKKETQDTRARGGAGFNHWLCSPQWQQHVWAMRMMEVPLPISIRRPTRPNFHRGPRLILSDASDRP